MAQQTSRPAPAPAPDRDPAPAPDREAAARTGVVGFGRAGRALANALADADREVAVHSSSSAGRERVLAAGRRLAGSLDELVADSDVLVCAVPDGAIGALAADLAAGGRLGPRHVVVHLSGRHGLGVLDPVLAVGAARAAVHPVMTLPGGAMDAALLAGTPFGVTADPAAEGAVAALVSAVGGQSVVVPDEARAAYHAAIVLGANFLGTLVSSAVDVLAEAGVEDGATLLGPLLRASLDNALRSGDGAATGPVRRADIETLAAHRGALDRAAPWVVDAYVTLATLAASRLAEAGLLDRAQADAVRAAVHSPSTQ